MYEKQLSALNSSLNASAKLFVRDFGKTRNIKRKSGDIRNLVTDTDVAIEKILKKLLLKHFPTYAFLGEEGKEKKSTVKGYQWIVDPIDGTTNFIQGIRFCAMTASLYKDGLPLIGIVMSPIMKIKYTAIAGNGATLNSKPIHVSRTSELSKTIGGLGWGREVKTGQQLMKTFLPRTRKVRVFSCSSLEICFVASGEYDFYINGGINLWDFSAAQLILKEAGGTFTDFRNQPAGSHTKKIVATNSLLHSKIVTQIK